MKTHFTADDIGKTFATSQEGVTATINRYDTFDNTIRVDYSNGELDVWIDNTGESLIGYPAVYTDQHVTSEADLLRKEIEELKEQLRTSDRHRAEDAWSALGEINSWRDKYNALKASHEADLRTAVEMARKIYGGEYLAPDEIIEKIIHPPAK
jgi:hypothetical protein